MEEQTESWVPRVPRKPVRHVVKGEGLVEIPVLRAVPSRDRVLATLWCKYCDAFHSHGNAPGGRVVHCTVPDSPYKRTGYALEIVEGDRKMLRPPRSRRRKPRWLRNGNRAHGWDEER